jgi:hypothetical protein
VTGSFSSSLCRAATAGPALQPSFKQNAQALGDKLDMAAITDNNRSVFKEAAATLLEKFKKVR